MIPFFSLFVQYQHDIHPTILLSGLLSRAGPQKHVIYPAPPIPTQGLDMQYRQLSAHRESKSAGSLRYSSHNNCHARCPIRGKVPPPRRSMQPRHSYRSGARTAVAFHCLPQARHTHGWRRKIRLNPSFSGISTAGFHIQRIIQMIVPSYSYRPTRIRWRTKNHFRIWS